MEAPSNEHGAKSNNQSHAKSNARSMSQRKSSASKNRKSKESMKSGRTKASTDNYTLSLAKEMIVRSKIDVRQPRSSKVKVLESIRRELRERDEKSKLRKER